MTQVRLASVRKEFGSVVALESIDLEIASGELVALLGPSGCGKTTTLRIIAGLERPSAGTILFDGRDMAQVAVQDRNVGLVSQSYALFPHMTVENNVAFGLSVRGAPKSEIAARVDEILDVVQLAPFRDRFPAQISGGQMQRVAIARTLVTRPSVLMMDEPLASLDTTLRAEMRRFIREVQGRYGLTTIFVTHDQVEAMELADRVALIIGGRLAQYDTPESIYRRPNSLAVARFMGATNVFAGRMETATRVATPLGTIDCAARDGIGAGDTVHVLLRAEALDMQPAGDGPGLGGRIAARDFFGASQTYRVTCNGHDIDVTETARRRIEVGREVRLSIDREHVWLLPG